MQQYREGQTATGPNGEAAVYRGGQWVKQSNVPAGATARPEYGEGAYETLDGAILKPTASGNIQTMRGAQTAGAEARTRLQLGLGPSIEAERNLGTETGNSSRNPLNSPRAFVATTMMGAGDNGSVWDALARPIGGQSFENMLQAAKSFETAFLPILSGAAVTPSEASRMLNASLPKRGDSPETLRRKERNRQMMINGAAQLLGEPQPFPNVGATAIGPGQRYQRTQGGRSRQMGANAQQSRRTNARPAGGFEILGVED